MLKATTAPETISGSWKLAKLTMVIDTNYLLW